MFLRVATQIFKCAIAVFDVRSQFFILSFSVPISQLGNHSSLLSTRIELFPIDFSNSTSMNLKKVTSKEPLKIEQYEFTRMGP